MRVYKHKQKCKDGSWADTRKWYIEFRDHHGVRQSLVGYTEKRVAEDLGRFIEKLVDHRASGMPLDKAARERLLQLPSRLVTKLIKIDVLDPGHAQALKTLEENLGEYIQSLRDKQSNDTYVRNVESRIRLILKLCNCKSLQLLAPATVQSAMAHLREKEGLGAQTISHYLTALKQFANWLHTQGRCSPLSLGSVSKPNVKADLRHPRRALSEQECVALLATASVGPDWSGISGRNRAAIYLTAIVTGLRASELRRLQVGDLRSDDNGWYLMVKAVQGKKNKRDVLQPISNDVGSVLELQAQGRGAQALLLTVPSSDHTARMLRADLKLAGIAYKDVDGNYADFHSLRHTFVTRMVRSGADAKVVQALARHSTPMVTMGRYCHAADDDLREAVSEAPGLTTCFADPVSSGCARQPSNTEPMEENLPPVLLLQGDQNRTAANTGEQQPESSKDASMAVESAMMAETQPHEGLRQIVISAGAAAAQIVFETDAINHSATPPSILDFGLRIQPHPYANGPGLRA